MNSDLLWPISELAHGASALARASGLASDGVVSVAAPAGLRADDRETVGRWLDATVARAGLEAEAVALRYPEVERFLHRGGPAILSMEEEPGLPSFLLLLSGGSRHVVLLDRQGSPRRVPTRELIATLRRSLHEELEGQLAPLLGGALGDRRRTARARDALRTNLLGVRLLSRCWILRPGPGASFSAQLRGAGAFTYGLGFLSAHTLEHALGIAAWWVVGAGALRGQLDWGWLAAWALLLLTRVPLGMIATWAQGAFAFRVGSRVKRRVLAGVLEIDPSQLRDEGRGRLLGRVLETEALEDLALSGGLQGAMAVVELLFAAFVLSQGVSPLAHLLLLIVWVSTTVLVSLRIHRRRRSWTRRRIELTNELVEGMVGQRTRVAQQAPEHWHAIEDERLASYATTSATMDRGVARWLRPLPRVGLALGLASLAPLLLGASVDLTELAIAVGGLLLAYEALSRLGEGLLALSSATIAWDQISDIFAVARRAPSKADPADVVRLARPAVVEADPILEGRDLRFRYRDEGRPVLDECELRVDPQDKILLEGVSGSGKSTLANLIAGLYRPQGGLLLLRGLDFETLGREGWRARVVAAPQFHDNHLFAGSLAFNLLMGRGWPPEPADLEQAEVLCKSLGLGPVLERMPGGLAQPIGDTGWQLSHGEASRVYLGRAILQDADLMVLDESFGALDPKTLSRCLDETLERSRALIVIAHP